MSAIAELRQGSIGPDFLSVLQRSIRAVAIARNFPPPEDFQVWDAAAISFTVAEFLASPQTPRRLADLALHCQTDEGLRLRLQKTVANFLADCGRRTPVGRLVLRINEVLGADSRFSKHKNLWTIGGNGTPAVVDLEALEAAASKVQLVAPTAWRVGSRHGPDLDADSVTQLSLVLLEAAAGALTTATIAHVAAQLLGLGAAPLSIEANALDPAQPATRSYDGPADEVLANIRADEVLSLLNDSERIALGRATLATAELGVALGVSKSTAANIRNRAVAVLRDELTDEEDGQVIADLVLERSRIWTDTWTKAPDAT